MNNNIKKVLLGENLTTSEAAEAMEWIMTGNASEAQIGAYISALRLKGETVEEITGSAVAMRNCCNKLETQDTVIDIVGTGGDGTNTFNISTVTSFVVAAAGVKVAKHGNRSVSSKCGSADILEALGANITLSKEQNEEVLKKTNLCFMFAQVYHSAMKYVAKTRKELGIRTVFNILGPLANPAFAQLEVMGVYDEKLIEPLAKVLLNLGVTRGMVVHGEGSVDEISIAGTTKVCEIKDGKIIKYEITPEMLGLNRVPLERVVGGDINRNKEIALSILNGEKSPCRDIVVMNAAAALYISEKRETLEESARLAEELIDSKKAISKLNEFIKATNNF